MIVFGIQDIPDESEKHLRHKVINELFRDTLGLYCSSVTHIYRIGNCSRYRPIFISFQNRAEKKAVMSNAGKLKGTRIRIDNDYSAETLRKKSLLSQHKVLNNGTRKKDSRIIEPGLSSAQASGDRTRNPVPSRGYAVTDI